MVIYDLHCVHGHRFEAWFKDVAAYAVQKAVRLVQCSVCGSSQVERVPSALHFGNGKSKPSLPPARQPPVLSTKDREKVDPVVLMKSLRKYVKENFTDVGEKFCERAIAMHRGEEDNTAICGTATHEQRDRLDEEGVSYLPLPNLSHRLDN